MIPIPGGYAIVQNDSIWIPAVWGRLGPILKMLNEKTGLKRIIFSAVLNPSELKTHLKNIVKEWDEWFPEVGDYSHCIEIEYKEDAHDR